MADQDSLELEFDKMTPAEYRDIQCELRNALDELPDKVADTDEFTLSKGQQMSGMETSLVIIAHTGATLAAKVARDLWTGIIYPRLRARYGPRVRIRTSRKP